VARQGTDAIPDAVTADPAHYSVSFEDDVAETREVIARCLRPCHGRLGAWLETPMPLTDRAARGRSSGARPHVELPHLQPQRAMIGRARMVGRHKGSSRFEMDHTVRRAKNIGGD
jgi:hypothetical protein